MTTPAVPQKAPYPVEVQAGKTYWWCSCGKSAKQRCEALIAIAHPAFRAELRETAKKMNLL
jgi:hypothetical protein